MRAVPRARFGLKRLKVAAVDPNERRAQRERKRRLLGRGRLQEHLQPELQGLGLQFAGLRRLKSGKDEEEAVGPRGARLGHLPRVSDKILAQDR